MSGVRITAGGLASRTKRKVPGSKIRPTTQLVKGAMFSILGDRVHNARVLDLYAGTGSLGIEAINRGAERVDFVEHNSKQCLQIKNSLEALGFMSKCRIYRTKVKRALKLLKDDYGLLFLDPPYDDDSIDSVMYSLGESTLIHSESIVVLEHSKRRNLENSYNNLSLLRSRTYGDSCLSVYAGGSK